MGGLVLAARNPLGPPAYGPALSQPPQAAALLDAAAHILGHRFARPALLVEAMTHRSAARKPAGARQGHGSNERLEFIGDRVLGLLVAEWLIERYPAEQEGELGRRLAHLVSQPTLAAIAEGSGMLAMLDVAPGEERAGIKTRATVTADALEAAIGALYLDGGLDPARRFIRAAWATHLDQQAVPPKDPKSALQEWALARGHALPRYIVVSRTGPAHTPRFVIKAVVDGPTGPLAEATAEAGSKRAAERDAAQRLLEHLT